MGVRQLRLLLRRVTPNLRLGADARSFMGPGVLLCTHVRRSRTSHIPWHAREGLVEPLEEVGFNEGEIRRRRRLI